MKIMKIHQAASQPISSHIVNLKHKVKQPRIPFFISNDLYLQHVLNHNVLQHIVVGNFIFLLFISHKILTNNNELGLVICRLVLKSVCGRKKHFRRSP